MGLQDQASPCVSTSGTAGGLGGQFIETLSTAADFGPAAKLFAFQASVQKSPRRHALTDELTRESQRRGSQMRPLAWMAWRLGAQQRSDGLGGQSRRK